MNKTLTALLAPALALASAFAVAQSTAAAHDVRFVIVHRPGPAWIAGKSPFEQPGIQAHIEHYRQLQTQGKLVLGGPFIDASAGGMMVPEAGLPEQEIVDFAQADPAVRSGLLQVEVRRWLIGMKK